MLTSVTKILAQVIGKEILYFHMYCVLKWWYFGVKHLSEWHFSPFSSGQLAACLLIVYRRIEMMPLTCSYFQVLPFLRVFCTKILYTFLFLQNLHKTTPILFHLIILKTLVEFHKICVSILSFFESYIVI